MTRDGALKLLLGGPEGVRQWNELRKTGEPIPDLNDAHLGGADLRVADLRGVNLSDADLRGASLHTANLSGANLRHAHLSGANLHDAHLNGANASGADLRDANVSYAYLSGVDLGNADLSGANLRGAHISRADLDGASLVGANLRDADLAGANLSHADVSEADLTQAELAGTVFTNTNLSNAKGLGECRHQLRSFIGIDTLLQSRGHIPESFLRGCGVPDILIEHLLDLIAGMQPIQFCSCFISHSTADEGFCKRLHSRLRDEKISVWYAPEDLKGGDKLLDQIDRAIRDYDKLLLVLSEHSMTSNWVETEIRLAREREKAENRRILFPIRLVDFDTIRQWKCFDGDTGRDLAVEIREYYVPDFSNWKDDDSFEAGFARLMADLRATAE